MMNSTCFELVDSLLRDIMGEVDPALQVVPFGGKVVVFGGDTCQVLPVVKRSSRAMIVDACINNITFWPSVQRLRPTVNKRAELLHGDPMLHSLARWCHAGFIIRMPIQHENQHPMHHAVERFTPVHATFMS